MGIFFWLDLFLGLTSSTFVTLVSLHMYLNININSLLIAIFSICIFAFKSCTNTLLTFIFRFRSSSNFFSEVSKRHKSTHFDPEGLDQLNSKIDEISAFVSFTFKSHVTRCIPKSRYFKRIQNN